MAKKHVETNGKQGIDEHGDDKADAKLRNQPGQNSQENNESSKKQNLPYPVVVHLFFSQ
jgi:hypothetical protein